MVFRIFVPRYKHLKHKTMEGVNKAIIMGTVGMDPEVRKVGDRTLTKFTVATNRSYDNKKTGERTTETQWHNIESWGPLAESLAKNIKKGKHIYLEGEIRYGKYEKDGITRYTTTIMAKEFKFAGSNTSNGETKAAVPEAVAKESVKQYANASAPSASEPTRTASSADVMDSSEDEDELPF